MSSYYEQTLVKPGHPVTKAVTVLDPAKMPRLVYLLNDGELPDDLRKDRPNDAAPMTVPLITDNETIRFTKEIQKFIYSLNPSVAISAFGALFYTWFPNGQGDTNIGDDNYISNPNYSGDIYPYFAKLTLGGNTYMADGAPFLYKNTFVYRLMSIDVTKPLPEIIPWWKKTYLTIWSHGKVIRFPQGDGNDCFTAMLSAGDLYIDARRVTEVFAPPVPYRW